MLPKKYKVELLDKDRNPIALVSGFVPIDTSHNFLEYITKLSDYGSCRFRIPTRDKTWTTNGDIALSYANHVRVSRSGSTAWQGVMVNNPIRNSNYIEIQAYEYEYLLKRAIPRRDPADGNGAENYRNFKSGSMDSVLRTLVNEAVIDYPVTLGKLTVGTIVNPTFPTNFTDINNAAIGGQPWQFSNNFQTKFDYRSLYYMIDQLAIYAKCDWEVTKDLVLNFKPRIGADKPELLFEYAKYGSIENYNAPRSGENMANHLIGVAADNQYNILKEEATDQASITKYGKISDVVAYADVKNINLLRSRLAEELRLTSTPDSELHATLNHNAYPLGQYGIGDGVTLKVTNGIIQVNNLRKIVAIDVKVSDVGKETIRLVTNLPRPS